MAFDKKRQQTVLIAAGETWIWDGDNWNKPQTQRTPPPRNTTHLVYDSNSSGILLWGGIGVDGTPLNDMWLWNGTTWTEQLPPDYPAPMGSAAIACDAAHGQVVLFGGIFGFDGFNGSNRVGTFSNETWIWNGAAWTEQFVSGPVARAGAQLVYDEARQQLLLFGGQNLNGYLNDMWLWTGAAWTQLHPTTLPPAHARYSATYHQKLQQVMLLGEIASSDDPTTRSYQTWLWDGTNWSQATSNAAPSGSIEGFAYDEARQTILACVVAGSKALPAEKGASAQLVSSASIAPASETWVMP